MSLNNEIVDIEIPDEIMFNYFCCKWFYRIIFTSISLFYQRFKICINNEWCFIGFLVSLEDITILQKSSFSHTFLRDSSLFMF